MAARNDMAGSFSWSARCPPSHPPKQSDVREKQIAADVPQTRWLAARPEFCISQALPEKYRGSSKSGIIVEDQY